MDKGTAPKVGRPRSSKVSSGRNEKRALENGDKEVLKEQNNDNNMPRKFSASITFLGKNDVVEDPWPVQPSPPHYPTDMSKFEMVREIVMMKDRIEQLEKSQGALLSYIKAMATNQPGEAANNLINEMISEPNNNNVNNNIDRGRAPSWYHDRWAWKPETIEDRSYMHRRVTIYELNNENMSQDGGEKRSGDLENGDGNDMGENDADGDDGNKDDDDHEDNEDDGDDDDDDNDGSLAVLREFYYADYGNDLGDHYNTRSRDLRKAAHKPNKGRAGRPAKGGGQRTQPKHHGGNKGKGAAGAQTSGKRMKRFYNGKRSTRKRSKKE